MATIYVDEKYGFNTQDSTIPFFEALVNESGKGNTVIFRNMGSPWNIGAQVRLFDFNDITVIFEPGCVVRKKLVSEGGYWQSPNIRRYKGINALKNSYPNGVSGTDYYTPTNNQAGSLIAILRCNNAHFIAYGAEFIGVYPQDNPGKDPATTPNARDFSYEFGHMIMFAQPGNGSGKPCSWRGGWIHNFSGDGINVNDSFPGGDVIIEDVKVNYCKRLGIAHIHGQAFVEINDCDVSLNGKADIDPVWGTNTRQGITIEPNKGNETVKARYKNLRLVGNSSCGLGLNMGKCDSTAPAPIEMYFEGLHLDGNSDQVDYSAASAMRWNGTDMYNTEVGEVDGDNPLDGIVEFKDVACWGDVEGFMYYRGYDGKPSFKFNNTVIYKTSTTGLQVMAGDAVNEWVVGGGRFQPTHTLKDFDWGDVLCIHDKNEPFISLEIIGTAFNQVEPTVTGNLTIASPNTGAVIRQKRGTLTDNNTIAKKQYTLTNFPKNQVSVVGTKNAIKTTNQNGEFTFTRSGDTSFPMAIHYEVSTTGSNAEMMIDFKLLRGSVVIPKGQTSVTLPVVPLNENRKGGDRAITLTITPKADLYTIGTQTALVFLSDEGGVIDPPVVDPPIVSNFQIETVETNRIVVSWNLSTGGTGTTEYDTNSGVPYSNQTATEKNFLTFHRQSIRNLQPNTTYYFRVTGQDNLGNVYVSEELSTKTLLDNSQPPIEPNGNTTTATILVNS